MRVIRLITTTIVLLCSTITLAQNTFYTKGLKVEECYDEEQGLFRKISENDSYLSTFRVMDMFKKVNLYSYDFDITLDVVSIETETEFIGYSLHCVDETGESAIITVNLDQMWIGLWLFSKENTIIKETFKINIIK